MAQIKHTLLPGEAEFLTNFPQYVKANGSQFPVSGLAFDAAVDEAAFWRFKAQSYGSGNPLVNIHWYADTATSGDVIFSANIGALTPNVDTQDIETKALAGTSTVTDTHLGTTGQRLHLCTITIGNLDAIAADDEVYVRLTRDADNAGDSLTGDVIVTLVEFTYSDT